MLNNSCLFTHVCCLQCCRTYRTSEPHVLPSHPQGKTRPRKPTTYSPGRTPPHLLRLVSQSYSSCLAVHAAALPAAAERMEPCLQSLHRPLRKNASVVATRLRSFLHSQIVCPFLPLLFHPLMHCSRCPDLPHHLRACATTACGRSYVHR